MKASVLVAALATIFLAACSGSSDAPKAARGGLVVSAAPALTFQWQILEVTLTASPGGYTATLAYDPADGQFKGSLLLPVGAYTVAAVAWADTDGDGTNESAGTATTPVVIVDGGTAVAVLRIVDTSAPPSVPDHAPIISAVTASDVAGAVGQPLTFSATAVDVDGDAMTYAWTASCDGTFSAPTAATTTWTPAFEGLCSVQLEVTANGLADVAYLDVPVGSGGPSGTVQVTVSFQERPYVSWVYLDPCYVDRVYSSDASCPDDFGVGQDVLLEVGANVDVDSIAVTDNCGGSFYVFDTQPSYVQGLWTPPATPAVCVITARIRAGTFTDSFPIAVNVR
jgi:hypothetical protein